MVKDVFENTRDPINKRTLEQLLLTGAADAVVTCDGTVQAFQTVFDVFVQRQFISHSGGSYER